MSNMLVCYFSASGVTKKVGDKIADYLGGDVFEIKPLIPYTSEDLDWTNKESRSSIEMADKNSRPQIANKIPNLNDYETILIGFPVWWDLAPTIINTFMEENDLTNKRIFIFVTSGSSSVMNSLNELKRQYPNLNIIDGVRLNSSFTKDEIENLLNKQ